MKDVWSKMISSLGFRPPFQFSRLCLFCSDVIVSTHSRNKISTFNFPFSSNYFLYFIREGGSWLILGSHDSCQFAISISLSRLSRVVTEEKFKSNSKSHDWLKDNNSAGGVGVNLVTFDSLCCDCQFKVTSKQNVRLSRKRLPRWEAIHTSIMIGSRLI